MENKVRKLMLITGISTIVAVISLCLSGYLLLNQPKVAYVNNARILQEYNGIKEGKQLYQQKINKWQAQVDTLESQLKKEFAGYQMAFQDMSDKERSLTETLMARRQQEFLNHKKSLEQKAQEEDRKITQTVLKQIDSYILDYGNKHNYDYIYGITEAGNLLFARDGNDITDQVLNGLNNTYEGS